MSKGWIGCDLDGTLAFYDEWHGVNHIGDPIPEMQKRVKEWIANNQEVRIFTARVALSNPNRLEARSAIQQWCLEHFGVKLRVTAEKDFDMIELWDDRCICVERNTGKIIGRNEFKK